MKYSDIKFINKQDCDNFIEKINEKTFAPITWNNRKGLQIYGCFCPDVTTDILFVYGETITPEEIKSQPSKGIFSIIKTYGSSMNYKGLLNIKGDKLLSNNYDDLSILFQTEVAIYIKLNKQGQYGLASYRPLSDSIEVILPCKYENIFEAGEFTFGIVSNGSVGFASLEGKIIIEPKYKNKENYNYFHDGKSLTCLSSRNGVEHYIDHYGNVVGYPEIEGPGIFSGNGTGYYPLGELPDASEAYEDDSDALWNTD